MAKSVSITGRILYLTEDPKLIEAQLGGQDLGLDPISAGIVEHGGLFAYNRARLEGRVTPPALTTAQRPMTLCEKILAAHAIVDAKAGRVGAQAVRPGDAFFARADVRFSHEYV